MDKILRILIPHFICLLLCILPLTQTECRKVIAPIASACTPPPRPDAEQYLIGYGSLMSTSSKNRTYPNTLPSVPINVAGFARSWNCKGVSPSLSTTYLGVYRKPRVSFNGVLFKLANDGDGAGATAEQALHDYDLRERFYCRQEVARSELQFLCKNGGNCNSSLEMAESKAPAQYWIYVTKPEFTASPSDTYPIVQSYVDTWLSGCLEIEEGFGLEDFAKGCIKGTEGWSKHWENDRLVPRRPFLHEKNALRIDTLLHEGVPKFFDGVGPVPVANVGVRGGGGMIMALIFAIMLIMQ